MKWTWRAPAADVTFHLNYLTSGKRLEVDGKRIAVPRGVHTTRWQHDFMVGDRAATLVFALRYFLLPRATLDVEGAILEPVEAPRQPPAWVWVFALANAAVLILTAGGAFPGMLAGVGIVGCLGINFSWLPLRTRLLLCVLVTAGVWGAVWAIVIAAT